MDRAQSSNYEGTSSAVFIWENPGVVWDRFGHPVDTTCEVWFLTDPSRIRKCDWSRGGLAMGYREAAKAYIAHCIETKAPHTVANAFHYLVEDERLSTFATFPLTIHKLQSLLEEYRMVGDEWKFHWIRKWYVWCADLEILGFYDCVRDELLSYSICGNDKGVAVLTADDEEGPLDDVEYGVLRSVVKNRIGSDLERACIMLCMELGSNPKSLVLLEERDFQKDEVEVGQSYYSLKVPRIKKRSASRAVRYRKISRVLGDILEGIIANNSVTYGRMDGGKSPILRRDKKRVIVSKSLKRFEHHMATQDFAQIVLNYPKKTNIISHRTSDVLHLNPRRLRYTFATRLVEQGASPAIVADALDHTDLQHVGVYFLARGKTVDALDRALETNPHYVDIINRFCGTVVDRNEANKLSVIPGTTPYRYLGGIGGCGKNTLCSLYPPLSCYLCPSFQAWKDGPHQEMLDEMKLHAKAFAKASAYPVSRIPNQVDDVILAISQLLKKIESMG